MNRLIWNRADGSCVTTVFPPNFAEMAEAQEMTEAELLADVIAKLQAHRSDLVGLKPIQVEESDIEDPSLFGRGSWGHGAKVDLARCCTIHMNRIRNARNQELLRLDIEQLKGNDVTAAKQHLRDLPANIDLNVAANPAALDAIWPPGLPARR